MSKKHFFAGTFLLSTVGVISRIMGFFYRIFLSQTIGSRGIGLYQLVVPLQHMVLAVTTAGIQTALSRTVASQTALKRKKEAVDSFCVGTLFALGLSLAAMWIFYTFAGWFAGEILKEPETEALIRIMACSFPFASLHACISSYYFGRKSACYPACTQTHRADCARPLFLYTCKNLSIPWYCCYRPDCRSGSSYSRICCCFILVAFFKSASSCRKLFFFPYKCTTFANSPKLLPQPFR